MYIETWLKAEQGETARVYTSVRRDTKDPVWDEYIELELEAHMLEDENAVIQLQVQCCCQIHTLLLPQSHCCCPIHTLLLPQSCCWPAW